MCEVVMKSSYFSHHPRIRSTSFQKAAGSTGHFLHRDFPKVKILVEVWRARPANQPH